MSETTVTRNAQATRRRILEAAFREFYGNGFQGGSLNRIVASARITKGALFHHFSGKQALGYAVVDEVIEPLLSARWVACLSGPDPIAAMQEAFRRYTRQDIESGSWLNGCPLNNLAQEMSPLDEGFHVRIDKLYNRWRAGIADGLAGGVASGVVRGDISPAGVAALIVAAQMGIWGTGKSSCDAAVMLSACEATCDYLESLRA